MPIFTETTLNYGPWQEFERNTARLLLHAGWINPRIVGRSGDGGADVLATSVSGHTAVFQCKFSGSVRAGVSAIQEVRNAGRIYGADLLRIVTSQDPTKAFSREIERLRKQNLPIQHIGPTQLLRTSDAVPIYPQARVQLRDYQIEAIDSLRNGLLETGRAQLVLATGLGKTVIMAELVADLLKDGLLGEGRILVVAHTIDLVNQLIQSFWRHLPKTVETHRLAAGERPISWSGLTFASIQTLYGMEELPFFDLVVVDEAHHLGATEYWKTVERLQPPKLLGVTATPWRSDGTSIGELIGPPLFNMGIKEGLELGFLSEVDYRILIDNLDWSAVKDASAFGYSIAQLNKRLIISVRDEEAIKRIARVFTNESRKRGIVFSPSITHAKSFASDLRRHGLRAEILTSELDHIRRHKVLAQFAAGQLDLICVVDIFNEGIDVPNVDLLVFMRVTHSRRIFVQQLGRGLRIGPEKENVIVLDFAADVRRIHAALDIAGPVDLDVVERINLPHAIISFNDRSMGSFFYEWVADLGNIQDFEEDEIVRLPIIDPERFNYPDPIHG